MPSTKRHRCLVLKMPDSAGGVGFPLLVGAAPSWLPCDWQQRLADKAVRLALLFQELGYVGCCRPAPSATKGAAPSPDPSREQREAAELPLLRRLSKFEASEPGWAPDPG